jgi:ribonuclease BN (tRNA processing enzyme)
MEVTILGSGSGLPQLDKHLSSILIRQANKLFLADCGDSCSPVYWNMV